MPGTEAMDLLDLTTGEPSTDILLEVDDGHELYGLWVECLSLSFGFFDLGVVELNIVICV